MTTNGTTHPGLTCTEAQLIIDQHRRRIATLNELVAEIYALIAAADDF